jgi:ribosome-binding protein aMBF1 (putative translation factor)
MNVADAAVISSVTHAKLDYSNLAFTIAAMMRKSIHTKEYAVFLELLIEVRQRVGLTQAQLGEKLLSEQPGISKIERGERRLDVMELKMICERLGISLGDFVAELEKRLAKKHG